jgi:hypothetical protein
VKKYDYNKNRDKVIVRSREWEKKNPERKKEIKQRAFRKFYTNKKKRFNELMLATYKRNKDKYISRRSTFLVIFGRKESYPIIHKCKKCRSLSSLQIHHEEYPTRAKDIRKAIDNGKIYFLCRACHLKIHRNT